MTHDEYWQMIHDQRAELLRIAAARLRERRQDESLADDVVSGAAERVARRLETAVFPFASVCEAMGNAIKNIARNGLKGRICVQQFANIPREPPPTPAREYERAEIVRQVRAAVEALPDDIRELAWKVFAEGEPYEAAGLELGFSRQESRSRIARARRHLRESLQRWEAYIKDPGRDLRIPEPSAPYTHDSSENPSRVVLMDAHGNVIGWADPFSRRRHLHETDDQAA